MEIKKDKNLESVEAHPSVWIKHSRKCIHFSTFKLTFLLQFFQRKLFAKYNQKRLYKEKLQSWFRDNDTTKIVNLYNKFTFCIFVTFQ